MRTHTPTTDTGLTAATLTQCNKQAGAASGSRSNRPHTSRQIAAAARAAHSQNLQKLRLGLTPDEIAAIGRRMNKNAQLQTADQTLKGAVLALGSYIAHKNNVDPQIIALSVPVAAGVMAWISTLVGNKNTACLFVDKDPDKK
jgi:aminopeptidase N